MLYILAFVAGITVGAAPVVLLHKALTREELRTDALLDRLQSNSLEQYKAVQEIPDYEEPEAPGSWIHDDTGLISTFVPEGT